MALLQNLSGTPTSSGGTTTPGILLPQTKPVSPTAQSYGILGTPGSTTYTGAPSNFGLSGYGAPSIPMGTKATAPTPTAPSNSLPPGQSQPIDYTLHNGESIQAYNARIAAARTAQGNTSAAPTTSTPTPTPMNTTGTSQGLGMGGGAAPAGYSYNAQGQIVPTSSLPTNQPPQTFNTNPYNASAPTYGGLIGSLAGTAAAPSPAFTAAQQQAQQALADLQTSRTNEANALSLNAQTPIPLEFQQGRGQILQNQYLAQQNAYANTYQGATAQETAATGQQSAQQSGLGAAAGLLAPQLGQYGQTYYNPLQGSTGTGGAAGVSPSDPFYASMQTYAQDMVSGQMGAIPSSVTGNPALMAQLQTMAKQINPNFNFNQAQATGGTQQAQTQQQQQYQSAAQQAKNLGTQLNQIITQAGINPSNINAVNSFIQSVATQTSNPNYQTFQNLINDMANTYAQVLTPAGGNTTDMVRNISQSLLNAAQSGQSILQVMQNLDAQVQAKISGVTTAYGPQSNTSSGSQPAGWF